MDESSEGRRLLIATGAVAADVTELPALIRELIESASEILVITPILPSRLAWLVSDTDRARFEADERLESVLGQVEAVASTGAGVFDTLKAVAKQVLTELRKG